MNWKRALLLICALSASQAFAQSFTGRIVTSFYTYERSDTVGTSTRQARAYQGLLFDYRNGNVLLRAYGQFDHDVANPLSQDPKLRLYNFYLQWRNIGRRAELKIGRQPVFGGVAVGTIDGAQLKVRLNRSFRLKAFAGALMPANQKVEIIDEADENYLVGGQLRILPRSNLDLSLSYFNKRQSRPGYNTLRADSIGNVYTQFIQPATRAFQMAAFDGTWRLRPSTALYARTDVDMYGLRLTRGELALRTTLSRRLSFNTSYTYRSPRLPWNSIFAVFDSETNHELQAGFYYSLRPNFQLTGDGAVILYEEDSSLRFSIGANTALGSFNFVHRGGYAGSLDGVNAYFYRYYLGNRLMPTLQLSWASYKLDKQEERETLLSSALGLLYRPQRTWTLDTQFQVLHNEFYDWDTRLLLRLQYWFFNNLATSSTGK